MSGASPAYREAVARAHAMASKRGQHLILLHWHEARGQLDWESAPIPKAEKQTPAPAKSLRQGMLI